MAKNEAFIAVSVKEGIPEIKFKVVDCDFATMSMILTQLKILEQDLLAMVSKHQKKQK